MPEESWIWQCDQCIPSHVGACRQTQDAIIGELAKQHWSSRDIFSVRLALEEALINAIRHGNQSDPNKQVHIVCRISPRLVRIEIADEGPGFNPNGLPDPTDPANLDLPGGRGVMLMRSFMNRVVYGPTGNQVALEKDRTPPDGECF
jgi:serine/threonine-protein kinase RsbW